MIQIERVDNGYIVKSGYPKFHTVYTSIRDALQEIYRHLESDWGDTVRVELVNKEAAP